MSSEALPPEVFGCSQTPLPDTPSSPLSSSDSDADLHSAPAASCVRNRTVLGFICSSEFDIKPSCDSKREDSLSHDYCHCDFDC